MIIIVLFVSGLVGLAIIFGLWSVLTSGVSVGNSSALASNYPGFNVVQNALPWAIPIGFIFLLAFTWWWSSKRG